MGLRFTDGMEDSVKDLIYSLDSLSSNVVDPELDRLGVEEFDRWMRDVLQGKKLEIFDGQGSNVFDGGEAASYWCWRFLPENIVLDPVNYAHESSSPILLDERCYDIEGVFLYSETGDLLADPVVYGVDNKGSRVYAEFGVEELSDYF